jgi:aminopeptidase N
MKRFIFGLLALLACTQLARAQHEYTTETHIHEAGTESREHPADFQRLVLNVQFRPAKGEVFGTVTHHFRVLQEQVDSILLDAPGVKVTEVISGGKAIQFRSTDKHLVLYFSPALKWGKTDSLRINFNSTPRKGIYFIGWNDATNRSRKQIWTQGQATDHRYWFPCYDDANDKVQTEVIVNFDKAYQVLSNGRKLTERENADGTKTWHYRLDKPHAAYLLMIAIGQYAIDQRVTKSGVPLALWYYPDQKDRVANTYRYSTEIVEFMERETGIPYPWGSYAQVPVQDFIYGAMENTSATVFGDFFCLDDRGYLDRNYVNVNCHELVHQWFGDYVTHRAAKDMWLHESYATFYAKLFEGKIYGKEYYQHILRQEQNAAIQASEKDDYPIRNTHAGTSRFYPKGSAVIHMFRYAFGEEAFHKVINHYLKRHALGNVETNDLYQSFQDTLGLSPDWFFDQWLYRGGEPHYKVSWRNVANATEVNIRQIQAHSALIPLFKMPIVVEAHYTDGTSRSIREDVSAETEVLSIPNPDGRQVSFVLFDPGSNVLKRLTFAKPFEELKAQALGAPEMLDRHDAVAELRNLPAARKTELYAQIFKREKFHYVKTEIVQQLVNDSLASSREIIRLALLDPSRHVRQAVITNVKFIPSELLADYEKLLTDSSYTVIELALDKLAEQYPQNLARYLKLTEKTVGVVGHNVLIKSLEVSANAGNTRAITELVDKTTNAFEFRTRALAMQALKRLNYLDNILLDHLLDALFNPNGRLSAVAGQSLAYYNQQRKYRALIHLRMRSGKLDKAKVKQLEDALKV